MALKVVNPVSSIGKSNLKIVGSNIALKPKEETKPVIKTLPSTALAGGGAFYSTGKENKLYTPKNTHTTYGGVPKKEGYQRADIIPAGLGGANVAKENITYEQLLPDKKQSAFVQTATDKYLKETVYPQYKSSKNTLGQARIMSLKFLDTKLQEAKGVSQNPYSLTNLWGGVKQTFGGLTQNVSDIVQSVKELPSKLMTPVKPKDEIKQLAETYVKSIYETNKDTLRRASDLFNLKKQATTSEKVAQGLKFTGGLASSLFAPITAVFATAEELPIVDTLSKIVTLPFSAGADIGKNAFEQGLKVLPLDQKVKNNLKEAVGEIGSLAGMLLVGGKLYETSGEFIKKKAELVKKFGEQDANTIIEKAKEKVKATEQAEAPVEPKTAPTREIKAEVGKSTLKVVKPTDMIKDQGEIKSIVQEQVKKAQINKPIENQTEIKDIIQQEIANRQFQTKQGRGELLREPKRISEEPTVKVENEVLPISEVEKFYAPKVKEPTIETTPSGVAKQFEAKAIEKGLIDKGYAELAEYDASTLKKQAELGSKYTSEEMYNFAVEGKLPEGMKSGTALSVAEDYVKTGEQALKLANSSLYTQLSESASELSLSRLRDSDSAVAKIHQIIKTKEKAVERQLKGKDTKTAKAELKTKLKDKFKTKEGKLDVLNFIDSITC